MNTAFTKPPRCGGLALGLLMAVAGGLCACQIKPDGTIVWSPPPAAPGAAKPASPLARFELRDRAENLLVEATRSDIDLIAANAVEALENVAPTVGKTRFAALTESDSALVRFAALIAIGNTRDRTSATRVQKRLNDPDPRARLAAQFAAIRLGRLELTEQLFQVLNSNPDENLRSDAAFLIGKLKEPRAKKRLEAALEARVNKDSNRVRTHIIGALAELGDRQAIKELCVLTQGDVVSRVLALQMLTELNSPDSQKVLRYVLNKADEYRESRLLAARGLGRIGDKSGQALALESLKFVGKNAEDVNETARVRQLGALALGAMRSREALDPLAELAANSKDEREQVAACYAICQILGD